jgi:integrase
VAVVALRDRSGATVQLAADPFLSSTRCANPNTRRAYASVLYRPPRPRPRPGQYPGEEVATALKHLWGTAAPATWNQGRAAAASWLVWCARNSYTGPSLPAAAERHPEHPDETKALPRAEIERLFTRRDVPLPEKTLWRMLYETATRVSEILALDIEDLDLDCRRAAVRSKGGATERVYWASGTAHLLPRLIRGLTRGPVFLAESRPGPARRPAATDLCPDTGRARLGYDRARVLLDEHTTPGNGRRGWDLHQLWHSAVTHLGKKKVGLGLLMAKTRHRNPAPLCATSNPAPSRRRGHRTPRHRPAMAEGVAGKVTRR